MHYAIGDVHGYYQDLMQLLKIIKAQDPSPQFILLGDLVDRGPESLSVLEWAMNHCRPGSDCQCLRGNHEDLILQWYQYRFRSWEQKNRERDPLLKDPLPRSKFDFSEIIQRENLTSSALLQPYMDFLNSLPYSMEIRTEVCCSDACARGLTAAPLHGPVTYRLVHGWYKEHAGTEIIQRHLNLRGRVFSGNPDSSCIIIHGHTPTTNPEYIQADPAHTRPGYISYRPNAINLDGGRAEESYQGRPCMLCAICLETLEEYYVHV